MFRHMQLKIRIKEWLLFPIYLWWTHS